MQSDNHIPKLTYSIKEACQASSLGRTTLYAHIKEGRLQTVKLVGRTLIPAASLEALLSVPVANDMARGKETEVRHGSR
jgi:excisionase family DNA binding protein